MKKILFALMLVALITGHAIAADYYWDSDLTAAGNDAGTGANLGGTGTWDTSTLAWWDPVASPASDIAWTDGNAAIFTGSTGAITIPVTTTRSATALTFKTDQFNLTATGTTSTGATARGIITLTGAPTIVVDPGILAGITAKLSGSVGFALSGGGTLRLAEPNGGLGGLNNITGNFSVSGGTVLEVVGGGQLGGTTGSMTLNNGTYRNMDPATAGSNFTTGTARNIVVGAGGGTLDASVAGTQILLYTGTITGPGNTTLTKTGPGEIRMSSSGAAANFTFQKLRILEGRYTIGQAATLGSDTQLGALPGAFLADAVTLDGQGNGAILRFNGGTSATTITTPAVRGFTLGSTNGGPNIFQVNETNATIQGVISGTGGLSKTGSLILNLDAANTYSGGTSFVTGTVGGVGGAAVASGGTIRLNNTTGSGVGSGPVTVGSTGNLQIMTTTTSGQAPGGVTVSGGTLSGTGTLAGALTLSGGKVATGIGDLATAARTAVLTVPTADFSAGNILESTLGSAGSSDKLTVTTVDGLTLNGGTITLQPATGTNLSGQSFTLINYSGTQISQAAVDTMLLNNITGFDATLDRSQAGLIKVNIGTTGIDRTWIRETDGGLWNNDAPPGPNESANWALFNGTSWVTPATAANGVGAKMTVPAVSPIAPNNPINGQFITLSDFTKTLGTLVLDNPNTIVFTSATNAIRLRFENFSGNALIDVKQGTHTINTGATTTAGGTVQLITQTDIKVASGATLTMGPTANIGGMNKLGTGMLKIIGGDWNQTGATNIKEGTLQYSGDNASGLGNSSVVTIDAGATLDMNSSGSGKVNDTFGALAGAGLFINHGNLTLGGVNTSPVTFSGTMGISASLGGNDSPFSGTNPGRIFTKNGSGVQIISATLESTAGGLGGNFDATTANTAAGTVLSTVAAGTLLLNNPAGTSLMKSNAPLSVSSGATLGGNGYINGPVTINVGGNLSPGSLGIGTFHTGVGTVTFGSATTGTVKSNLNIELNTTIANGDISDRLDASASTLLFGVNLPNKPTLNIINAGTMTGGEYTIMNYGTLSNGVGNLPVFGTTPAGFQFRYDTSTANVVKLQVHFNGDFNNDNVVDAGDYVTWRKHQGILSGALFTQGDANNDGAVNNLDYDVWRANFGKSITVAASGLGGGAVPEPGTLLLAITGIFLASASRRRR